MAKAASRARSRRKSPSRKASAGGSGGMVLWCLLGAAAFGGIVAHDNWTKIQPMLSASVTKSSAPASEPKKQPAASRSPAMTVEKAAALPTPPAPILAAAVPAAKPLVQTVSMPVSPAAETIAIKFGFCGQGAHKNCVDDGRTFFHEGDSVVISGIATPSADRPKCDNERRLGIAAKIRLLSLLNSGPFSVRTTGADKGVFREGRSLGTQLVNEGLARPATATAVNWCA